MSDAATPTPPLQVYWMIIATSGDVIYATDETLTERLVEAEAEYGKVRTARVNGYAPPELQPNCQCRGNPIRQMFCPCGQASECHFPMTCTEANCGHAVTAARLAAQEGKLNV